MYTFSSKLRAVAIALGTLALMCLCGLHRAPHAPAAAEHPLVGSGVIVSPASGASITTGWQLYGTGTGDQPGPSALVPVTLSAFAGGAKCDGVTDDSAKFATATTALAGTGQGLYVPPGTCSIASNQTWGSVAIWGTSGNQEELTGPIILKGTRTTLYSGTAAAGTVAYTPGLVGSGGVFGILVDASVTSGAWSTSGLLLKHFVMTSGAHNGAQGVIIGQVSGHPTQAYYLPISTIISTPQNAAPSVGDNYSVYSVTTITGKVEVAPGTNVELVDLMFDNSANVAQNVVEVNSNSTLITQGCHFRGGLATQRGGYWQSQESTFEFTGGTAALVLNAAAFFDSFGNLFSGGYATVSDGAATDIVGATVVTGTTGNPALSILTNGSFRQPYSGSSWLAFLNSPGQALYLASGAVVASEGERIWGVVTGTPSQAVQVDEGAQYFYGGGFSPQLTGATNLLNVGSTFYASTPVNVLGHGSVWDLTNLNAQVDVGASATGDLGTGLVPRFTWSTSGNTSGTACTAAGQDALAVGSHSLASKGASTTLGFYASSESWGQVAEGNTISDGSATAGHSQGARTMAGGQTTNATPLELLGGDGNPPLIGTTRSYAFSILVVARQPGGARASWTITGLLSQGANAAATTLDGSTGAAGPTFSAGTVTGWAVAIAADTSAGGYKITVTGAAATTINWHAYITHSMVFG